VLNSPKNTSGRKASAPAIPRFANVRAVRSKVLGRAVRGGTEKRNAPPAITRSTDNTEIPLRTTTSGTVFAGVNLEDVEEVAEVAEVAEIEEIEEVAEVAEVDGIDEVVAFDNVPVFNPRTCVKVVVAGAAVVAISGIELLVTPIEVAATLVEDGARDTFARTTLVPGAAAEPTTLSTTAKNPTNHKTRTRRTPRRYNVDSRKLVQARKARKADTQSRTKQTQQDRRSQLRSCGWDFGREGAKIGTCRIPQRPLTPSYRLPPRLPKSSSKSKNEFSPSP
jgi:hypothetical protein